MGEKLIKPYEISIWEDELVTSGNTSYYKENKIAIIGSDTMEGLNKVYEPIFTKKINGEKTLSFSLKYQYFDPYIGATVINPFSSFLVNERKVKLKYDNEWHDFIIKDHTESSDGLTWTYSAVDAFVNELSKNGYNKEFSTDLNNNQGTALELATKTLEGTDWTVETDSSFKQLVEEPIYKGVLVSKTGVTIINASGDSTAVPAENSDVYVFYSYVANKNGKFVQFIIRDENRQYTIDDNNVINDTNFRITTNLIYNEDLHAFTRSNGNIIIQLNLNDQTSELDVETQYKAYRLVYEQLVTYDPVMGRTVKRYQAEGLSSEVYQYTDYDYSTSNIVTNYITNGENFNTFDNGTLQGWYEVADYNEVILRRTEKTATLGLIKQYTKIPIRNLDKPLDFRHTELTQSLSNDIVFIFKFLTRQQRQRIFEIPFTKGVAATETITYRDITYYVRYDGMKRFYEISATGKDSSIKQITFAVNYLTTIPVRKTEAQVELVTYPEISNNTILSSLTSYSEIEGYMEVKFPSTFNDYKNGIFNSGIEDNATLINSISSGEKFVFRIRGGKSNSRHGVLQPLSLNDIRVVVAKYDKSSTPKNGEYVNILDSKNIILDFNTTGTVLNNFIEGGELRNNNTEYAIDDVAQEPSTKYIYKYDGKEYVWDSAELAYIEKQYSEFLDYYYMTATAKRGVSKKELTDSNVKFGIFIYAKNSAAPWYYFQDLQLTKYYTDKNHNIVTIGSIPEAAAVEIDNFYVAPKAGSAAEEIQRYNTIAVLAKALGCEASDIKPLYNKNSEKYLTINESNSNCFNILQTIAETFECWIDLQVAHADNGAISLTNGVPNKKVILKQFVGKDNFVGFKYGINLDTIERTVDSNEIVTKLIVTPVQSEYTEKGDVAIQYADANPSGEQYILNFDYYYNQGLISNKEATQKDIIKFNQKLKKINDDITEQEKQRRYLEKTLTALESKRNVYSNLITEAKNAVNEGKREFKQLTNISYDSYQSKSDVTVVEDLYYYPTTDTVVYNRKDYYTKSGTNYILVTTPSGNPSSNGWYEYLPDLAENETIIDIIGKIYINSYIINNYTGLLTNIQKEYLSTRQTLRGSEQFNFTVTRRLEDGVYYVKIVLSDYVVPFSFKLDGTTYTTDYNTKSFDIETNQTTITNVSCPNYTIKGYTGTITAIRGKVQTFIIKPNQTFDGVEDVIDGFQKDKELEIAKFYKKYSRFIQEGTWSSTDYIDSNLYYLDALQVSNTSAQPKVTYSIKVIEISELEGFEDYNFNTGDKTYIEDTEFFGWGLVNGILTPGREEVIVSEIQWCLEEPENTTIVVQNYKTRFEDLFQRISATVQTVQYNEATYAKISTLLDSNGTINQDVLLTSISRMAGEERPLTTDGSIQIHGDEILIHNVSIPANYVMINNEGIKISADGAKTWGTAISGRGINIGAVYTGSINTDQITIGAESNPSFRWDKAGISAYKLIEEDAYDLQTYVRFDQYGLYGIKRGRSFKAESLEDVLNKAHFGVTWDGFFIKNSYTGGGRVEITSNDDFRVLNTINGQEHEKIKIGALEWGTVDNPIYTPVPGEAPRLYGIRIRNNDGFTVFKTTDEGNIEITGTIYADAGAIGGMIVNNNSLSMNTIVLEPGVGIYSTIQTEDDEPVFIIRDTLGQAVFNSITARGHIEATSGSLSNLTVFDELIVGDSSSDGLIQSYNYVPEQTGWMINSDGEAEFSNAIVRGHIEADTGEIGGMIVDHDKLIMDTIVLEPGVGIYSTELIDNNEAFIISDVDGSAVFRNIEALGGKLGQLTVTDTITVGESVAVGEPVGLIKSVNYSSGTAGWAINANGQAEFSNATVRGHIEAQTGDFTGWVAVGDRTQDAITNPWIVISGGVTNAAQQAYGSKAIIQTSNYQDGASYGWKIDSDGDAVFNNITARGAIKTAVFEYAEIQAVGGIFIFRPSSTIRSVRISGDNLVFQVEKPALFAKTQNQQYSWCKISNYTTDGSEPNINSILNTNGLTHVYQISNVNISAKEVTLAGAKAFINAVKQTGQTDQDVLRGLIGGALVDMGRQDRSSNYGIGINSSDNTVNLPARAISLFETIINNDQSIKVSYDYKGILGTLPQLNANKAGSYYNNYMAGTQGIYTDNMYIGDNQQYIVFYTDNQNKKHLRISAKDIVFGIDDETGQEITWEDHIDEQIPIRVEVNSNIGNFILTTDTTITLTCTVYKGQNDITNQVTNFIWTKKNQDGTIDANWIPTLASIDGRSILVDASDIQAKAIFICTVEI